MQGRITFTLKQNARDNIETTTRTTAREGGTRRYLADEPSLLSGMRAFMIVSALDVDDDEGMCSLDTSRLTTFSGSSCLN